MTRNKKGLIVASVVLLIIVSGIIIDRTTRKPHVSLPAVNDVYAILVMPHFIDAPIPPTMSSVVPDPMPIMSNTPQGKVLIKKVMNLLSNAQEIGIDRHTVMFGPKIDITTKSNEELSVLIPWTSGTSSSTYIDVETGDKSSHWVRYYSPKLNSWIESGWKHDLHYKAPY